MNTTRYMVSMYAKFANQSALDSELLQINYHCSNAHTILLTKMAHYDQLLEYSYQ